MGEERSAQEAQEVIRKEIDGQTSIVDFDLDDRAQFGSDTFDIEYVKETLGVTGEVPERIVNYVVKKVKAAGEREDLSERDKTIISAVEDSNKLDDIVNTLAVVLTYCVENHVSIEEVSEMLERGEKKPREKKLAEAKKIGALLGTGGRVLLPSIEPYKGILSPSVGKGHTGLFTRLDDGKEGVPLEYNYTALHEMLKLYEISKQAGNGKAVVYIPQILKELGQDPSRIEEYTQIEIDDCTGEKSKTQTETRISRAEAREKLINKFITDIDNIWCRIGGYPQEYKLIAAHKYDRAQETLEYQSPLFDELLASAAEEQEKQQAANKQYYWKCELLHSNAASERSQIAVEMASHILTGVLQRGNAPDKKRRGKGKDDTITYNITCKGLVDACPMIKNKLNTVKQRDRSKYIQRNFTYMYRILEKKSDLFTYYQDLEFVSKPIPTVTTMDQKIVITHHGLNPKYEKPIPPIYYVDSSDSGNGDQKK